MADLITEFADWLHDCGRSPRTITARVEILRRIDRDLPYGLVTATTDELRGWLYRDYWSPGTRETYYGAIRAFFTWATGGGRPDMAVIDYDPSEALPKPATPRRIPRPVTDDQLRRILTEAAQPYRLWATLAAYAGLRCIEISRLDRGDITAESIRVLGKGNKPGVVPTHPIIWAAVRDLPLGPIAYDDHGQPAGARWVSIRSALHFRRQLGMPGVSLHRLRHWYGTSTYRATRDIRVTQELMRHASPATTAGYTLVSDEERTAAIHALPIIAGTQQR